MQDVFKRVFSFSCLTPRAERNRSIFGFLHSKNRNLSTMTQLPNWFLYTRASVHCAGLVAQVIVSLLLSFPTRKARGSRSSTTMRSWNLSFPDFRLQVSAPLGAQLETFRQHREEAVGHLPCMSAAPRQSFLRLNLIFMICHWLILVLTLALSPSFGELILHDSLMHAPFLCTCAFQNR